MLPTSLRFAACLMVLLSLLSVPVWAAPFSENVTFRQPNGTEITLHGQGDEYYAEFTDLDGYTVVFDPATATYYYAQLSADGNELVSTGKAVGSIKPGTLGLGKGIKISPASRATKARKKYAEQEAVLKQEEKWNAVKASSRKYHEFKKQVREQEKAGKKSFVIPMGTIFHDSEIPTGAAMAPATNGTSGGVEPGPPSFTLAGDVVGLTILVDFSDAPGTVVTQQQIDDYFNKPNYTGFSNAGSVYDYFFIQSGGNLRYNNTVTYYVRVPQPKSYYNNTATDCGICGRLLVNDALNVLLANGYDFSKLTTKSGGNIRACNLFFAGANSGVWSFGLWPHRWVLSSPKSVGGGKYVYDYEITEIGTTASLRIGTICHENGHMLLGYPDLYSYDGNAAGVGNYSLMDGGNYGGSPSGTHPVNIDPYLKEASGWMDIIDLNSASSQRCTVQVDGNQVYRYLNPAKATEYFMFEVRDNTGYEGPYGGQSGSVNPGSGLVAYHVYETGSNPNSTIFTTNNPNCSYTKPYELLVLEANPKLTISPWYDDPTPDTSDAFKSSGKNFLSDYSTPVDLRFWVPTATSGGRLTASGCVITNISIDGSNMTFNVGAAALSATPSVVLSRSTLDAYCNYGTNAAAQSFTVCNGQGGTLNYTITNTQSWLSCSPTNGTSTNESDVITVNYATSGLAPGSYSATITVTDPAASPATKTITVGLTITAQPILTVSPTAISTNGLQGVSGPTTFFRLSNTGGGTCTYNVSKTQSWLTLATTNGTMVGESDDIFFTCNATALAAGTYNDTITITANATNSPRTIPVTYTVQSTDMIVTSPNGGEQWTKGTTNNITWVSSLGGNVKIELYKAGVSNSTIIASAPNNGTNAWIIPGTLAAAADYTVKITSIESPSKSDTSDTNFTLLPTLAEALDTTGLTWVTSGNTPVWYPQTATTKDAVDAAQSGVITDSQTNSIQTTIVGPGTMTFWWKVSSEAGYDYLIFYLNGVEQTGALARISGTVDWTNKTVNIPAGTNVVKWTYAKDVNTASGSDAAWVDMVVYTPTSAAEIAVEQPVGNNLVDGSATINFGLVNVGSSSAPFTFNITNAGTADLTGLALTKSGTHSNDFTLGSLATNTLAPGANATFTVTFAPSATGVRTAALQIASNDGDENPFDIALTGNGNGTNSALLVNLVPSAGTLTPAFTFNNYTYTSSVSFKTNSLMLTPTAVDTNATITINGNAVASGAASTNINLNLGANVINTVVVSQDTTETNTYTLTITRAVGGVNPYLTNLLSSIGGYSPSFASNTFSYTATVPFATNSLTLTPFAADTNAAITVNGNAVLSGAASGSVGLNVGTNVITAEVVAENGAATNTYILSVTRTASIFRWWDGGSTNINSPGDGISGGGNGSWDTTIQNWDQGSGQIYQAWNNTNANIAVFGGAAGIVTNIVDVAVGGLIFTNAYTLTNAPGTSLSFSAAGSISNSANVTIATPIASGGPITKTGGGTLALSGTNTCTNGITVSAGVLQADNNSAAGTGLLTMSGGGLSNNVANIALTNAVSLAVATTVGVPTGNNFTLGGVLTNSGILTKTGAGTLLLTNDNTFTGGTVISNGTLQVGGGGNKGSLVATAGVTNNAALIYNRSDAALTESYVISGSGTVTKSGSGAVTLTGANTYTGTTTVSAGTLNLNGNRTAAAGAITVATGALGIGGGNYTLGANTFMVGSVSAAIVNHTNGNLSFVGTGAELLVGNGSGDGTYNLSGGSLTTSNSANRGVMLGVNTGRTGTFNLSGGTLTIPTNTVLQISRSEVGAGASATNSGGIFNQTGGTANIGELRVGGADATYNRTNVAQLNLSGGIFVTTNFTYLSGGIASTSSIVISGTADVTLPAIPTTHGAGSTATIYFDGGTLRNRAASANYMSNLTAAYLKSGGARINTANGDITIAQNLLTDPVSFGGSLTKDGVNTLTLNGVNTYTGSTTNNAGTLTIGGAGQLGSGNYAGNIANNAAFIYGSTANQIIGGVISGGGTLTKSGASTLTLTSANTMSGGTTVSAGTLQIGAGGATGSLANTAGLTNNAALIYNRNDAALNENYVISGSGTVTKIGSGTVTLSGANTFSGATTVNTGALFIAGNAAAATGRVTVTNGATLGGLGVIGGAVTNLAGSTLAPGDASGNAGKLTLTNGLGLNGAFLAFTLTNASAGAYDQVAITNGSFVVNGLNLVQIAAATNQIPDGTYVLITNVVARTPAANQFVFHQTGTTNWVIGGATLTLLNNSNSVVLTVSGGPVAPVSTTLNWQGNISGVWDTSTLNWQSNGVAQLYADGNDVFFNDGASTFTVAGTNVLPGSVTFNNNVNAYTFSASTNTITGTAFVTKNGAGVVNFNGTNNYSGGTVVNAGTVVVGSANNAIGTALVTLSGGSLSNSINAALNNVINLAANATVASASATTLTLNGALTNAGSLTKTGAGQLTLNASNSYSGGTVLTAGTLATTNDFNFGNGGGITVNGNPTWSAGPVVTTYNRSLTINDGAVLSLTSGNAGKTITGVFSGNGAIINTATTGFDFNNAGNTFSGVVSNGYQMSFTSLADSTNAIALIGSNSQFIWNGGAKLFALRPFTLNATGTGNLINNGTGALTILQPLAITGTSGARTLALQGSNTGTNRFAGNITDGPGSVVSLNVSGTAVWGLSGTNTYSGATTIGNGNPNSTLVIQGLQALSPNTTIAMTANSTPASTLKLLDDGTGVLTLSNTLTTSFGNTTLNNLIVVGNNNTANGGISAGTTSGTTIALRKLSLGANAGVGTQGFKEIQGFNNYKLQFNSVDLPGFLNGNATWKAQFNPTTAAVILAGTIQQLAGNTTAGPVTLELAGTNIANLAIGNIKDAVDYPGSATAVALMVTKTSSSTWTLSGTNTFSGGLTLSGASVGSQLNINSATALGTGTFTISGGNNARFDNTSGADITLTTNAQTWNNDFVFVGSTNLNLGNGAVTMGGTRGVTVSANTLTVGGLGGAAGAGLTKAGNGALVLNGTNTYTGATTVNFGALLVNGDASAATNNVRVGVFGTFGGTGIVGGVTTFTNNSGKLLLTLTPTAATAYSNSTYLTFTNAVFLTNVTVTVNMPTNLGNGVYVLATNYVTPVTGGSLNFVTNSGALAAGGSGVVSRSGNNLVLTVSGVFANFITTNTVTTSASPVPYSTAVTFTSTVQTNAPLGAATAAGSNVVFSVDGTPVATNALSSGVATYVNNTLTNGTHTITAAYLGDGLYLPSTNTVSQVITKLTPILKTAPVASAITAGQGLSNSVVTLGVFTNLWGTGNVVVMSSTNFLTPGLVPNVGTTNVQVYFVPSDLSNYNYVTNVVAVLVKAPGSFSGISVTGTALTLTVTNGIPNGAWTLLESTNLLLPIAQWPTNRTGTYDGSGNLTTNIANLATNPAAFYLLK